MTNKKFHVSNSTIITRKKSWYYKQIWIKIQIIKKLAEKADNQFYGKKELYLFQRTPAHLFILRHNAWYKKKKVGQLLFIKWTGWEELSL